MLAETTDVPSVPSSKSEPAPLQVFKCLSDATRLAILLTVLRHGELCVCELTHALDLSQPKVSRHLAQLRGCHLLSDRREGQWVYYRLSPSLPEWTMDIFDAAVTGESARVSILDARLASMGDRPQRRAVNCQDFSRSSGS